MKGRYSLTLGVAITLAVLLGSVSAANAQYPPGYGPPPGYGAPRMYRDGLVVGFGLGFGVISAPDCGDVCGGAFSGELHLGGMLNPRMAVMADLWSNIRDVPNSDATAWSGIYTAALQYWATDIIWLKGGLGLGHMQIYSNVDNFTYGDEWGFAAMGAAGIEVVHASNFALDLQLRLGRGFYSQGGDVNNFGFMVGLSWY